MRTLVVSAALVGIALAGCLGAPTPEPKTLNMAGMYGFIAKGDQYDGMGILQFNHGVITVFDLDNETGTATILASGKKDGKVWRISCGDFKGAADSPFQGKGVVRDLIEHGDSGHGDTALPKFLATAAAWGKGTVTVGPDAYPDEISGDEKWICHLMATKQGFRDDATRAIFKDASRTSHYDRLQPDKGLVDSTEKDHEVHLLLKSHPIDPAKLKRPDPWTDQHLTTENVVMPVVGSKPTPYAIPLGEVAYTDTKVFVNASLHYDGSDVPPTGEDSAFDLWFVLKKKDGANWVHVDQEHQMQFSLSQDKMTHNAEFILPRAAEYRVEVIGNETVTSTPKTGIANTYPSFDLSYAQTAPAQRVYDFWFEDVVWGQEALKYDAFHLPKPAPKPTPTATP